MEDVSVQRAGGGLVQTGGTEAVSISPPQRPLSWRWLAFDFTQRPRRLPALVGALLETVVQQTTRCQQR